MQCRAARSYLGWTYTELSAASNVPVSLIDDFECDRSELGQQELSALRQAFENADIDFFEDNVIVLPGIDNGNQISAEDQLSILNAFEKAGVRISSPDGRIRIDLGRKFRA